MKYIKVHWIHENTIDPIFLLSEISDLRYEVRKIEIFRDGHFGFADENNASEGTMLGIEPIPSVEDISLDPQFSASEISKSDFEKYWQAIIANRIN